LTTITETEGAAKEAAPLAPVASGERIENLDVLRGFALFGVLVVNGMTWFRTSTARDGLTPERWPGLADKILEGARVALFDSKFITLFSFLFGVGMTINAERAEARGGKPTRFLLRRLFVLLLLGAAHVALLWVGDILHAYALLGMLSLVVIRRKDKTIAITAGVLLALPFIANLVRVIIKAAQHETPMMGLRSPEEHAKELAEMEASIRVYSKGTWLEILHQRLVDFVPQLLGLPLFGTMIFALFLLGVLAHRRGILRDPASHRVFLRRFFAAAFPFGLLLQVAFIFRPAPGSISPGTYVYSALLGLYFSASMGMGLSYGAGLLLLLQRPRFRKWMAPIGKVGRMALSNYLAQSLMNSLVFYGFGLGLYDKLSPLACFPIFVVIYAIQVAWSGPWLKRFEYGPVEWLWRSLTYGKMQPMRARSRQGEA